MIMAIRIVGFDKIEKNTFKGFITVAISDRRTGIEICLPGFTLHEKGNVWVELPGMRNKNGAYQKDLKTMYFCDPIMEKQFKDLILEKLIKYRTQYIEKVEKTKSLPEDLIKFD
jgi:hypothetical protein